MPTLLPRFDFRHLFAYARAMEKAKKTLPC